MIKERLNYKFTNLINVIRVVEQEGYTTKFVCKERGFYNPESSQTYLPESISKMEFIRINTPFSDSDTKNIIYLLETVDSKKGWLNGAYSYDANDALIEHINRIKENFSCLII